MNFSYPPMFEHNNEPAIWQNPFEFALFINLLRTFEIKTFLEIGTGYGLTLDYLQERLGIECWGIDKAPKGRYNEKIVKGNSHEKEVVDWAKRRSPFDAIFIDGDHSYVSVNFDFTLYKDMATKLVFIHDIDANQSPPYPCDDGVKIWWETIDLFHPTIEIRDVRPKNYGLGVIFLIVPILHIGGGYHVWDSYVLGKRRKYTHNSLHAPN